MSEKQVIVLVTGANGGIGYELVSQLMSDTSKHVLLGSRSAEKGAAAIAKLKSQNPSGSVELVQLDVSSPESITAAAKEVELKHGRLDALVNNAAAAIVPGTLAEKMATCYQTNTIGPLLTVEAFAPLMKKSITTPRIINVSSGVGSIARRLDPTQGAYEIPAPEYRASKAALNMITANQAVEFGVQGFKVFAFCPGHTVSNMGPMNEVGAGGQPTSEGAKPMVGILNGERDGEHGMFLHAGGLFPW